MSEKRNYNRPDIFENRWQKLEVDKLLLKTEYIIASLGTLIFISNLLVSIFVEMVLWLRIFLPVGSFIVFVFATLICLRIEQIAGYYQCEECRHRYAPTFRQVLLAMHVGRTRYLKCPHCGRKSWNKKVL